MKSARLQAYQRGYALGNYRALLRAAMWVLGGHCARCHSTDRRVLSIDHVRNDGAAHRKALGAVAGPAYLSAVLRGLGRGERKRYQLLCANCHARKSWRRR